jgi:hypothetical protein
MHAYRKVTVALFAASLVVLCTGLNSTAGEKSISKKDLPAQVLEAFEKAYPKAEIEEVCIISVEGASYYEIECEDGKVERDVVYFADGRLFQVEVEIDPATLPASVKSAVERQFPGCKIKEASRITRGAVELFEVEGKTANDQFEVLVGPDGKIEKSDEGADDDDQGEGEEGKED